MTAATATTTQNTYNNSNNNNDASKENPRPQATSFLNASPQHGNHAAKPSPEQHGAREHGFAGVVAGDGPQRHELTDHRGMRSPVVKPAGELQGTARGRSQGGKGSTIITTITTRSTTATAARTNNNHNNNRRDTNCTNSSRCSNNNV
jgi:hypothetical protein